MSSLLDRLRGASRQQLVRYILVGGWNTLFGYCVFAGFTYALTGLLPYAYMVAAVLAHIVATTVSYVAYKVFVFKTKGNYLREYLRFYVVYGVGAVLSLTLLPIFVYLVTPLVRQPSHAPYVAQALVVPLVVLSSFIGHKRFSFRT
jgi:putative flippase GtrA